MFSTGQVTSSNRRAAAKPPAPTATDDEIRQHILEFLYHRNQNATSPTGKRKGSAVRISDLCAAIKEKHGHKRQQVVSNVTFLVSEGWVREVLVAGSFTTPRGAVVPSTTTYYRITALGMNKVGGNSRFMRDDFHGVKIDAGEQSVIAVGTGIRIHNRIDNRRTDARQMLLPLRQAVETSPVLNDAGRSELLSDIDCLETQLAKAEPNKAAARSLWDGIQQAATAAGLVNTVGEIASSLARLWS